MDAREREVTIKLAYGDMLWAVNAMRTEARRLGKNGHAESAANLLRIVSDIHSYAGNTALAWLAASEANEMRVAAKR